MKDVLPARKEPGPLPFAALPPSPRSMTATSLAFSPTAVLPEQFFSLPRHHYKGEAALMYAVLEDAFNCFVKQFVEHGPHVRRLAQEAEEWFFSDDERWPFSFVNVCIVLDINPEYARKGLQHWRQQRPARIRQIRGQVVRNSPCLRTVA